MKCMKCHNTLHSEIGEFSMTINGKSIKVINAPVLHCKNCNSVIISDEVKEKAKEFSKVYLYPDNTLDYAECGTQKGNQMQDLMPSVNFISNTEIAS